MGRHAEREGRTIYALSRRRGGAAFPGITIPNAICFSPDGAFGYFADTAADRLYRVRLDPTTGLPLEPPSVLRLHAGAGGSRRRGDRCRGPCLVRHLGRRPA